jgi:hypothetical protein
LVCLRCKAVCCVVDKVSGVGLDVGISVHLVLVNIIKVDVGMWLTFVQCAYYVEHTVTQALHACVIIGLAFYMYHIYF